MAFGLEIRDALGGLVFNNETPVMKYLYSYVGSATDNSSNNPMFGAYIRTDTLGLPAPINKCVLFTRGVGNDTVFSHSTFAESYGVWFLWYYAQKNKNTETVIVSDIGQPPSSTENFGVIMTANNNQSTFSESDKLFIIDVKETFLNPSVITGQFLRHVHTANIPPSPPGTVRYFLIPHLPDDMTALRHATYDITMFASYNSTTNQLKFYQHVYGTNAPIGGSSNTVQKPHTFFSGYRYL